MQNHEDIQGSDGVGDAGADSSIAGVGVTVRGTGQNTAVVLAPTPPGGKTVAMHMAEQLAVAKYWLRGYNYYEIAAKVGISRLRVVAVVKTIREEIVETHKDTLDEAIGRTLDVLRMVQAEAWGGLDRSSNGNVDVKYLNTITRAEEIIAKVTGALTTKVIHGGVVKHKLYDFKDEFPKPIEGEWTDVPPVSGNDKAMAVEQLETGMVPIVDPEEYESKVQGNMPPSFKLGNNRKGGLILDDGSILLLDEEE